jgi:hypothetical protein
VASIILPSWVERRQIGRCTICGARFWDGQEGPYQRHVLGCAKEHGERIVAEEAVYNRLPELYASDKERERWVHERRAAILEGRVKM